MSNRGVIKRNVNTAELVGLSFGDGSFISRPNTNKFRFQLRGDAKEDRDHYDNYIIPLFNKEIMNPIFGRNVNTVHDKKGNCYGISLESPKLKWPFKYLGIPCGIKKRLMIPKWIKDSSEFSKSFLKGIFDTDGGIWCNKNYSEKNPTYHKQIVLGITLCSKELISEIGGLLTNLNINHYITTYTPKNKNWQQTHTLRITGKRLINWFEIIGLENKKHITRFKIWERFGFCPPKTTLNERERILMGNLDIHDYYDNAGVQ